MAEYGGKQRVKVSLNRHEVKINLKFALILCASFNIQSFARFRDTISSNLDLRVIHSVLHVVQQPTESMKEVYKQEKYNNIDITCGNASVKVMKNVLHKHYEATGRTHGPKMGREYVTLSQISQTVGKHYDHILTSDLAEGDDITDNKTQPPLTYGNRQKSKHFPSQHQDMTDYW